MSVLAPVTVVAVVERDFEDPEDPGDWMPVEVTSAEAELSARGFTERVDAADAFDELEQLANEAPNEVGT